MTDSADPRRKWRNVTLLALAELLAMALWFSASAVLPQLTLEWSLDDGQRAWMTMSVQIGFVVGALISALLNLADRISNRRLFATGALCGAAFNLAIPILAPGPDATIGLRFLTGVALAGVYPPAMKLVATWCREDRGLGIGLLVAAITLGSATPHFVNALPVELAAAGMPHWKPVLVTTSGMAAVAALLALTWIETGPFLARTAPFDWRFLTRALAHRETRLANFGYLGHMWELYAMWAWAPLFLIASYEAAGESLRAARLAGFAVIAVGALGSVLAGVLADRLGRTLVAAGSLLVSGICAALVGFFFHDPRLVTALCLVWGFAVVADSAQFSAAVSELTDPRYVGTALTMQTCLGFLLTLVTLRAVPPLVDAFGWERVFLVLTAGPALGLWAMGALRASPEAIRMASGRR